VRIKALLEIDNPVVFGANGSGESSLINTIMGLPASTVTCGDILFKGKPILGLDIAERAKLGVGLSCPYPPVVEGVSRSDLSKVLEYR